MRLVSAAVIAAILAPGAAQARTVSHGGQAASVLIALIACARTVQACPIGAAQGDLSRSPEQRRRLAMLTRGAAAPALTRAATPILALARIAERSHLPMVMAKLSAASAQPSLSHRRTT